ncbi:MAG: hypothetical protein IH628_12120, partial [Proteobacteria bacterium]|nr:hypothetical protein [Pseudomonadota bacterium]
MSSVVLRLAVAVPFFGVFSTASAQSSPPDRIHHAVLQGIDELYRLEFDSSLATFDRVIQQAPSDPRGYFFKGMVHLGIFNLTRDQEQFA